MYASLYVLLAQNIFGEVSPPPGVANFSKDTHGGGLIVFISNLIKVVTIIAGLFGMFNIIAAGYTLLSSAGNAKATEEATSKMTMSLIGLLLIVGAYGITAIISLIIFGKADFILNPSLPSTG